MPAAAPEKDHGGHSCLLLKHPATLLPSVLSHQDTQSSLLLAKRQQLPIRGSYRNNLYRKRPVSSPWSSCLWQSMAREPLPSSVGPAARTRQTAPGEERPPPGDRAAGAGGQLGSPGPAGCGSPSSGSARAPDLWSERFESPTQPGLVLPTTFRPPHAAPRVLSPPQRHRGRSREMVSRNISPSCLTVRKAVGSSGEKPVWERTDHWLVRRGQKAKPTLCAPLRPRCSRLSSTAGLSCSRRASPSSSTSTAAEQQGQQPFLPGAANPQLSEPVFIPPLLSGTSYREGMLFSDTRSVVERNPGARKTLAEQGHFRHFSPGKGPPWSTQ